MRDPRPTTIPRIAILVLAAAAILAPGPLPAQTPTAAYDSSFFRTLSWRNIGPERGGRTQAVAGSPGRRHEYFFGATGGGLWKTTDGGITWNPVTDGKIHSSSVGAVAVAESNPDIVYIGMGETELRGNIMQGDGVYKSTDAGKTWTHAGLEDTQAIARVRIDPSNADIVYVAALGHPYADNEQRGVFRSRDGGRTWKKVLYVGPDAGAVDLVIDRTNPDVLYTTTWQVYRTPWKMWGGGPHSGLWKSTDGGDNWTELTKNPGMPAPPIGKIGITVSPADPNRLYALIEADSGGVYRSDDGGATWRRTNDERKLRQRHFYYTRIYADPKDPDAVYALNTGLYRSTDGGKTFESIRAPHGDHHDLWIDPTDPLRMIDGNDGGGNVSINGGKTWTEQDYATAQLYHIITTSDFPYHVCGAQQDNSTVCVPNDDWDNMQARGANHGWYYDVAGGESGFIAQDPKDPDIFFAGSQGALLTRYNRATGQVRDVQVYPRFFSGEPSSALPERWQWTYPIVFSPVDPNILYTVSQHVWRSVNDGQSWERISPDLTLAVDSTLGMSGGLITMDMNGPEIYATVFALASSYHDVNTIWAGSDDGLIHVTRDGGKTWKNVTPKDMPKFTRVSSIDASRHVAGTAYVTGKLYQLDDRRPYIWRTHDFGETWTKIVNGIASDDYVHVVREDPVRPRLLYAGTEHGVWISFDDGDHWQSLQLDLPDTQVSDLVVEDHDLVAGTHGRSIYVLDDIDPLRELDAEVAQEAVHLFQPADPVRDVQPAVIQFHLSRTPAANDTIRLAFLDAQGAEIRTFSLTPPDTAKKDTTADDDDEGFGRGAQRTDILHQGMNRFEWDLRYPGATTFEGMILWSARPQNGPVALPGRYSVRLNAGGQPQTRDFTIRLDPRLQGITVAELEKQFDLAMKIRDRVSEANEAVIRIRAVRDSIEERLKTVTEPAVRALADSVMRKMAAVEEDLYQVKNRSGQDPLNFPIRLNNRMAALGRSVETGDGPPTDGAYVVYDELSAKLTGFLQQLQSIVDNDLARLRRRLGDRITTQ